MKSLLVASLLTLGAGSSAMAGGGYEGSGECIGRVRFPAAIESHAERVLQSPGHVERRYLPARVERRWRAVLVRPAHTEQVDAPAVYVMRYAGVLQPGPTRRVREPARYVVRADRVVIAPGHWVWERRHGALASAPPQPGQVVVQPTGLILCKVWCPARIGEVERRVMTAPARSYSIATSVRRWTSRRVLVRPAAVVERRVPALYRHVMVSHVLVPARMTTLRIPTRYGMVESRRTVAGGEGWAPVVCGGPLTPAALQRMQASLAARGYDPGPPDGAERPQTYEALRRFQTDHGMAAGQITVESARALSVIR